MRTYYEMVYEDVKEWLEDEMESDFLEGCNIIDAIDKVYDELSTTDITGNLSGSYYCDAYRARQCVLENIDDVAKAYIDLNMENQLCQDLYAERWEKIDVVAREANLFRAIDDAVIDFFDNEE